ncbi:MAG: sulfotransferase [Symploca sp. SIO1B1]|nr:sulfotransferase [Symploca sp. SIO2D2]NER93726.1 sulfotransferase [Symploca sp. SIO1B1]
MKKPLFIVGTGRCGSTLLSNMVRQHPTCLSISEFLSAVADFGFRLEQILSPTPIDGEEFWGFLSTCYPKQTLLLRDGLVPKEFLYPLDGSCRYKSDTGVPPILIVMLPHLTDEPDKLFDELHTWVLQRPLASAVEQTRAMFQYLADRLGKTHWIERSGGSIYIVEQLTESFPEAKFLHLVRDGRNCAISMTKQTIFRMKLIWNQQIQLLGVDPFESSDHTGIANLPEELRRLLPENLTAEAFWDYKISPSVFGHFWSEAIQLGVNALRELPQERVLTLYYEDFLANPISQVTALAEFLDEEVLSTSEVEKWIQQSTAIVGKPKSPQWENLPSQEREELHQACIPGFEVLQAYI